jgi:hypothetical protein
VNHGWNPAAGKDIANRSSQNLQIHRIIAYADHRTSDKDSDASTISAAC